MSNLAKRIKEARDARGLTQPEVAEEVKRRYPDAKFSQQILSQLEKSAHQTTGCIAELADVLGVSTDWLALGKGHRDRDAKAVVVDNPKLAQALVIMQPMKEYQLDQALTILQTLVKSPPDGTDQSVQ